MRVLTTANVVMTLCKADDASMIQKLAWNWLNLILDSSLSSPVIYLAVLRIST